MCTNKEELLILPHHEQQTLCTSRLPYRQGRKLTAVKVYTINDESKHLLIFGVPALNLRQETKALFARFGKVLQFTLTNHPGELFTETYHALFERIQSARIAKKMLDTKNYYGGNLHVCYAPEFETVIETREKLMQRQKDVMYRLNNLKKEYKKENTDLNVEQSLTNEVLQHKHDKDVGKEIIDEVEPEESQNKLNMGDVNVIYTSKSSKRKKHEIFIEKKFKPTFSDEKAIEIIDCTSADQSMVTNINEYLNYDKFGNEDVRKVPQKAVNRIQFNSENKKDI